MTTHQKINFRQAYKTRLQKVNPNTKQVRLFLAVRALLASIREDGHYEFKLSPQSINRLLVHFGM